MAKVVGFKCWFADGSRVAIRTQGRNQQQVGVSLAALPTTGLQIIMLYYDEFSVDGKTRYRRILQGNDIYYILWDTAPPPQFRDWLFGQTNNVADLTQYPGAKAMTGQTVSDDFYKFVTAQAMADMNVSELGLTPILGTSDT